VVGVPVHAVFRAGGFAGRAAGGFRAESGGKGDQHCEKAAGFHGMFPWGVTIPITKTKNAPAAGLL
jgi:hypothetical protein